MSEEIQNTAVSEEEQTEQDVHILKKIRIEKLDEMKENGKNPFEITKFDVTICNAELRKAYEESEAKAIAEANGDDEKLKELLLDNKLKHEDIGGRTSQILLDYSDEGKEPNPMAKGMSWIKTNFKTAMADDIDKTVAKLITEGCDMGVNSLCEYLNKYKAAEEKVKDLTKELVRLEEDLAHSLREFL